MPQDHFKAGIILSEVTNDESRSTFFAVMSIDDPVKAPCKIVKILQDKSDKWTFTSVTPEYFGSRQTFRSCQVLGASPDHLVLFTDTYMSVLSSKLTVLAQLKVAALNRDIMNILHFQTDIFGNPEHNYLALKMDKDFGPKFEKISQENIFKGRDSKYSCTWFTDIRFKKEELNLASNKNTNILEFDKDMTRSILVKDYCISFVQTGKDDFILQMRECLLVIQNWKINQAIMTSQDFDFAQNLLMPGFHVSDFPIVLNYSAETFDVVNVLTGQRDVLIQGTAHNLWNQ